MHNPPLLLSYCFNIENCQKKKNVPFFRDGHEARALELARSLLSNAPSDFVVDTEGRPLPDIADEVLSRVEWVIGD